MAIAITNKKSNWRIWATIGFLLLLLLNVGLCAVALGLALSGAHPWTIFPEDFPPAARFVVFLAGLGAAWFCGRQMLEVLVEGEVEVAAAVTAAWGIVIYFLLFFVALAFAGTIHWAFLLILLLFALMYTIPAFWRLMGASHTGLIVLFCLLAGAVTVYLLAKA
jgi:hypothetical protein